MRTATLQEVKPLLLTYNERGVWNLHKIDCQCSPETNILETFEVSNTVEAEDIFLEYTQVSTKVHNCVPLEFRG